MLAFFALWQNVCGMWKGRKLVLTQKIRGYNVFMLYIFGVWQVLKENIYLHLIKKILEGIV